MLALIVAVLSDCFPGLDLGSMTGTSEPAVTDPPAAEPESGAPAEASRASIEVIGDQCRLGDGPFEDCARVCSRVEDEVVEVDAARGSHGIVQSLRECLEQRQTIRVEIRAE
jgi:hypothetical protein